MDIKLNYIEKGEGMPLILLHGNGESSRYFVYQIDYFSNYYRVIAVDTRGHGKSQRGTKPFTLNQFAEDLKEFIEEKKLSKINLLGFSDGANIALLFGLKYPQYLNKLILNGGDLHPSGVKRSEQLPIIIDYVFTSLITLFDKKSVDKKEMLDLMVNQPNIKAKELNKLDIPTLVIAGTNDMIKQSHTESINNHLKESQLCLIEGDHFIAKKKNKLFNEKVAKFLET